MFGKSQRFLKFSILNHVDRVFTLSSKVLLLSLSSMSLSLDCNKNVATSNELINFIVKHTKYKYYI